MQLLDLDFEIIVSDPNTDVACIISEVKVEIWKLCESLLF